MNTKPNKTIKILKISLNTFFYLIIALLLIFSIANIRRKSENQIPNIFGIGVFSVQSDSMEGTETNSFQKGDLIFVKMLNKEQQKNLQPGAVVTFYATIDPRFKAQLNTHRIVNAGTTSEGIQYYQTKGDNPEAGIDPIALEPKDIIAQYGSFRIKGAGEVLDYMMDPVGFAVVVILPVALFLIYSGVNLGRSILAINRAKMQEQYAQDKELSQQELEVEKEKMRQQILEELKKEQGKNKE
ncbi:MAG: signal peptidase I [Acholeplasmataceae bacterium]